MRAWSCRPSRPRPDPTGARVPPSPRPSPTAPAPGSPREALYHLWDSQEVLARPVGFMLDEGRLAGMPAVTDATRELAEATDDFRHRSMGRPRLRTVQGRPSFFARIGCRRTCTTVESTSRPRNEEFRQPG